MDTLEFFNRVLPDAGNRIAARLIDFGGPKPGWKYTTHASNHELAAAVAQFDGRGETVFFGTQGFGDWYEETVGGKSKRRVRTQKNVVACRSLLDDFDVGDEAGKYASKRDAVADIKRFASALGVAPLLVDSGGGIHMYFPLTRDVTAAEWLELSRLKRDITTHLGLKVDRAVDLDTARVLRPPGSHNRKTDTPREVRVLLEGGVYDPAHLLTSFQEYTRANHVVPALVPVVKAANPFAGLIDYPPSSAHKIVSHCTALKRVVDAGGNVPEPYWRAMLGLVKHTVEGDALCHEWSSGSPDYQPADTQSKLDNWHTGPTTCAQFDSHANCAGGCPHKVKSPIFLGYAETAPSAEHVAPTPAPKEAPGGITVDGEHMEHWPDGYRWDGHCIARSSVDEDGLVHWKPITFGLVYPQMRVRDVDGTWALLMRARERNGIWREFLLPTTNLASTSELAGALAAYEVFLAPSKTARADMTDYITDYTIAMQVRGVSTTKVSRFGWDDDVRTFTYGTTIIGGDSKGRVVCAEDRLPGGLAAGLPTGGTLEDWCADIDYMANRPGAEIMQFAICHAFGAPLVRLCGAAMWHGIPMAIVGKGGQGKSSIARIALSAFGHPAALAQGADDGSTTMTGMMNVFSRVNGLPYLFDELTGRKSDDLVRLAYCAGNGRDKVRSNTTGGFASNAEQWWTSTFFTSNDSIYDQLAKARNEHIIEATQLRMFEVALDDDYIERVFPDVPKGWLQERLDKNYGHAGRRFVEFIVENREWVSTQLGRALTKFAPSTAGESAERYYCNAVATAVVAGKIAQRLGLIRFDTAAMTKWARQHILDLREFRRAAKIDPGEHLAMFFASMHGRIIATKYLGDGRSQTTVEAPMDNLRGDPAGRVAHEDKKFYILVSALREWCKKNDVPTAKLNRALEEKNLVIGRDLVRIGAGTPIAVPRGRCIQLNYNAMFNDSAAVHLVQSGQVGAAV